MSHIVQCILSQCLVIVLCAKDLSDIVIAIVIGASICVESLTLISHIFNPDNVALLLGIATCMDLYVVYPCETFMRQCETKPIAKEHVLN